MGSIADEWWNEDRRDLFRSVEVIASDAPIPGQIGLCLDTVLNDLELYDDPREGAGMWLFENELELAEHLGEKLQEAVGQAVLIDAGSLALASRAWPDAQATAASLLKLMRANGDFTPTP
jgi:hypothetical protein